MAERANAASFEYLDTVADVEQFTSEIAATREIALQTQAFIELSGKALPVSR